MNEVIGLPNLNESYDINKNKTTFFGGAGTLMEFAVESNKSSYFGLLGNLGVNFKLSNLIYLNLGALYTNYKSDETLIISITPEIRFAKRNIEFFAGVGVGLGSARNGIGFLILPTVKLNYFFNDKLGIGTELNHPTLFDYDQYIHFALSVGLLFRF